ncbi:hypothetical protein GCM10029976_007260 [Kribbella albertanoniae]
MDPPFATFLKAKMLDRIGEVDGSTIDPRRSERLVEQPPGRPDEHPPLFVLDIPRLLAHQHHPRLPRPLPRHNLNRVLPQVTPPALSQRSLELGQTAPRRNPFAGTHELHPSPVPTRSAGKLVACSNGGVEV